MWESYERIKTAYLLLDDGDNTFLSQYDLTQAQFYALFWLHESSQNMTQLSGNMLCDPSNITRVAAILERKGLISRQRNEQDRRVIDLKLTPAGQQLYREVAQAHAAYTQQRMDTLTPAEQEHLTTLLTKLIDGLRQELQNQTAGA